MRVKKYANPSKRTSQEIYVISSINVWHDKIYAAQIYVTSKCRFTVFVL